MHRTGAGRGAQRTAQDQRRTSCPIKRGNRWGWGWGQSGLRVARRREGRRAVRGRWLGSHSERRHRSSASVHDCSWLPAIRFQPACMHACIVERPASGLARVNPTDASLRTWPRHIVASPDIPQPRNRRARPAPAGQPTQSPVDPVPFRHPASVSQTSSSLQSQSPAHFLTSFLHPVLTSIPILILGITLTPLHCHLNPTASSLFVPLSPP